MSEITEVFVYETNYSYIKKLSEKHNLILKKVGDECSLTGKTKDLKLFVAEYL